MLMRLSDIRDEDYYEIKTLGIRIKGKDLKHPGIRKAIHQEILRRKDEIENERRFYLNIGDTPVLQFKTEPPAYIIHSNFQGLRDLLVELDMQEDPFNMYGSIFFRGSDIQAKKRRNKSYQKYSAEIFGLFLSLPDFTSYDLRERITYEKSQYKCEPRYRQLGLGHIIQIWRVRLFSCAVTDIRTSLSKPLSPPAPAITYVEERWHPRRNLNLTLRGLEHLGYSQISPFIQFTKDALHIFGKTRRVGRPYWSGKYKSPEEFLTKYRTAYSDLLLSEEDEPIQQAVANKLRISVANLKVLIGKSEASWPPF